jgi:asparagine synthase (glutamine-hydrolysing)
MSAIFGIINKNGEPVDKGMIGKMQSSLLHRAVDGQGIHAEGAMMFGHHKLTVHRRQAQEKQPLLWEDFVITCDARIDNIDELFTELGLTPSPETYTDPFIILQAYKKLGNDCVKHLEGEFCFAIWNRISRTLFGVSDHIGFRTFYYYENDEMFAFASEIKALEIIKKEALQIDKRIYIQYYSGCNYPITYDKYVHTLAPATIIEIDSQSKLKKKKYWTLGRKSSLRFRYGYQWCLHLNEMLTKKIVNQIESDYPIGILLSGGLDSSFIASIACQVLKKQNKKLHAFCSVLPQDYEGSDQDERSYIEILKSHYDNLDVHYVTIPEDIGPYSNLEVVFNRIEEPPNIFHYVESALFRAAKELNVRTLLTGYGGDRTFYIFLFQKAKFL